MARTLINIPPTARRGEVVEVRTLIAHAMETGYRPGADGKVVPRDVIRRFSCTYDDGTSKELIFSAELFPAVAANPYIAFFLTATSSGTLRFAWEGDNGFTQTEAASIWVT